MQHNFDPSLSLKITDTLSEEEKKKWLDLFKDCYGEKKYFFMRESFDEKYLGNSSLHALLFKNELLVASYSLIVLNNNFSKKIGLSVDTMSNGHEKGSTVKICTILYPYLVEKGFVALLGFPNRNIAGLREKYLGWKYLASYRPSLSFQTINRGEWWLNRPKALYFAKSSYAIKLLLLFNTLGLRLYFKKTDRRTGKFTKNLYIKQLLNYERVSLPNRMSIHQIDVL